MLAESLDSRQEPKNAARAAVVLSGTVERRTVLYILRARHVIEDVRSKRPWLPKKSSSWPGGPAAEAGQPEVVDELMYDPAVAGDLPRGTRKPNSHASFRRSRHSRRSFDALAFERAAELIEQHERYQKALGGGQGGPLPGRRTGDPHGHPGRVHLRSGGTGMSYEALSWEGGLISPDTLEKLAGREPDQGPEGRRLRACRPGARRNPGGLGRGQGAVGGSSARGGRGRSSKDPYGTSRTRQSWIIPFLSLLGYELENAQAVAGGRQELRYQPPGASGRACRCTSSASARAWTSGAKGAGSSPHSLAQEYLNLSDTLYALVTNGLTLRLLRDSPAHQALLPRVRPRAHLRGGAFTPTSRCSSASCTSAAPRSAERRRMPPGTLPPGQPRNGSRIRERLSDAVKEAIRSGPTAC